VISGAVLRVPVSTVSVCDGTRGLHMVAQLRTEDAFEFKLLDRPRADSIEFLGAGINRAQSVESCRRPDVHLFRIGPHHGRRLHRVPEPQPPISGADFKDTGVPQIGPLK
jgi:hypothetical protein